MFYLLERVLAARRRAHVTETKMEKQPERDREQPSSSSSKKPEQDDDPYLDSLARASHLGELLAPLKENFAIMHPTSGEVIQPPVGA